MRAGLVGHKNISEADLQLLHVTQEDLNSIQ